MTTSAIGNSLKNYALSYAERGWHVFPLHSIKNGHCTCGRSECSPGKHPRVKGGLKAGTTNPEIVGKWWDQWPDANIGVATGKISGIVVIDLDAGHGGLESWQTLAACHPAFNALQAITGGGGRHFVFQAPEIELKNSSGEIGIGIDTRAEGGYIVAPPSNHISGRHYVWMHDIEPEPAPEWILGIFPKRNISPETGPEWWAPLIPKKQQGDYSNGGPHWVADALHYGVKEGQRNAMAARLAGYCHHKGLDTESTLAMLEPFADRCSPPMSHRELLAVIQSIARYPVSAPIYRGQRQTIAPESPHSPDFEDARVPGHPTPDLPQMPDGADGADDVLDQAIHEHQHKNQIPWYICTDCKETHRRRRKAALAEGRADSLTGEVRAHHGLIKAMTRPNAEFCTIKINGIKLCVAIDNSYLFIDHDDYVDLIGFADGILNRDGTERPMYKRAKECGLYCSYNCIEHGTKRRGVHSCKTHMHPSCPSQMAIKLSHCKLPNLEGEAGYREIWIHSEYAVGDGVEWQTKLVDLMDLWEKSIGYLARSKRYKGHVYFRSFAAYYAGSTAKIHWKCMIYEENNGDSDHAARYLAEKMAGHIEIQKRYQNGETAITQLVADSFSHFINVDASLSLQRRSEVFAAHYFATKGRHIFQGLGDLYKLLEELPEPEPLVCDECGRPLHQVLEARPRDDNGYNSPTSPNYIYRSPYVSTA